MGPYEIKDVIFGSKNYYWCSCGMSRSQPFCDKSHIGSLFKPLKFSIDEELPGAAMHLCGCKLTKNAPFCDGRTCMNIVKGETPEEMVHEGVDAAVEETGENE